jgi:ureidoacrylate peracid hydrolase
MRTVVVPAEPAAISLDLDRTALLIVDMQNAFASPGGMLDLAGIDVRPAREVIANAALVCEGARAAGMPVVYLTIGYPPDMSTAGGADSPNPQKELALCLMRERPELRGKLLTFGTWDFAIVDELGPKAGDLVIVKSRYSGFHGTELDSLLRGRGVRNLLMLGIASNVCVESTLRDAYFLEYWPVMVRDATMPAGPAGIQAATVYNVKTFFGWVATAEDVATALKEGTVKRV